MKSGFCQKEKGKEYHRCQYSWPGPSPGTALDDPAGCLLAPVIITARISDDVWPQSSLHAEYSLRRVGSVKKCRFAVMYIEAISS